jgi:lipid-A-disaccharide synthase
MKKIFILTGEVSGDKLASKIVPKLRNLNSNIEYKSVGGSFLKSVKVDTIYDLKDITYLGFTDVFLNLFKIKRKINLTVNKIIEFDPDILFSVDSPDFTLRVVKKVKKLKPSIKTIHFVSPQVWIWRENRIKSLKPFLDHALLLFPFEKVYFDKANIQSTFVGHPLLEDHNKSKINISQFIQNKNKIISIFPGSRLSEIKILYPILFNFIKMMNKKYHDLSFVFHSTKDHAQHMQNLIINEGINNCTTIHDEKIKNKILKSSIFAVAKSGTISLEICNAKIPSVIIYKMSIINYFIVSKLIKVRFANIINIVADREIIPELLQSKCTSEKIFNLVDKLLNDKIALKNQIEESQIVIQKFKTDKSADIASSVLINHL